jgi:two-component sensor histidine kinase
MNRAAEAKQDKKTRQGVKNNAELGRSLFHALHNTGIVVLYQDTDLRVVWAQNVPATWSPSDLTGTTDSDFLPAAQAKRVIAAKRAVIASGHPESLEISIDLQDGRYWFDIWLDADRDSDGVVRGVITTGLDITERKRREQTLKALLRELSHRSKNLLAIIQSIATQTGRYAGTLDNFLSSFIGRLQSIAASQDLVTSSNWRGADLHELALNQVAHYTGETTRSIVFEGLNPHLNPNAALHIGLALHELTVNSLSYGALARPGGFVTISAERDHAADGNGALHLAWTEKVGPSSIPLEENRFSSVALQRIVPQSLNGSASIEIENEKLCYQLVIPHGNFELD